MASACRDTRTQLVLLERYGYKTGVAGSHRQLEERDLKRWKPLQAFLRVLDEVVVERGGLQGTWADPQRKLQLSEYLGLYLLGLYNLM